MTIHATPGGWLNHAADWRRTPTSIPVSHGTRDDLVHIAIGLNDNTLTPETFTRLTRVLEAGDGGSTLDSIARILLNPSNRYHTQLPDPVRSALLIHLATSD